MKYEIDRYDNNADNTARYALGKSGKRPLFVMGLNPSTADDLKPDRTLSKIEQFVENSDFEGFMMLNLYAQRTPFPSQLDDVLRHELHTTNIQKIKEYLGTQEAPTVLAAWGTMLTVRPYLFQCLMEINAAIAIFDPIWLKIGDLTKGGHPRHPSRAAYAMPFTPFEITDYLDRQLRNNPS